MLTSKNIFLLLSFSIAAFFLASINTGCGVYRFNDVSIPDSIKTVRINFIENKARYVNPQISPQLTERVKLKINNQTKMSQTNSDNAHLEISGTITDYTVSTSGISNQQTQTNRLTVGVHITVNNVLGNKVDEYDISRSFEFPATSSLQAAEAGLMDEMVRSLTDDIFNRIFRIGKFANLPPMSSRFDLLTQELFQKTITDCSVDDLQKLVADYPYFAPAHFALVKKLEEENNPLHQAELQKAVLYYHKPPLFDIFLNEENYVMDVSFLAIPEEINIDEAGSGDKICVEEVSEEYGSPEITDVPENSDAPVSVQKHLSSSENYQAEKQTIATDIKGPVVNEETTSPAEALVEVTDTKTEPHEAEVLAFEPYHTIDYFASQGIKLSQEEATKDHLGKQLKSFTEWLKTMKRLPVKEQLKPIDPLLEKKVDNLAAHSVERAEVLTETMAEVWVKQGNREKAIETYEKLSLLNPSKRAYFAAKVDFLKNEI